MWPFGENKATPSADTTTAAPSVSSVAEPPTRASIRAAKGQQADLEFAEFIKSFQTPERAQPKTVVPPTPAVGGIVPPVSKSAQPTEPAPNYEPQLYEDGTVDIRPEVLYPRAMNCRQQFDQAFYCQSLGGKFNDVYRYGEFKSCSEQWSAFWFCMRTRTLGDDAKAAQTMEYYRHRDLKKKKEVGSSENVWDIRTRSVERAFWKDPDQAGKEVE